MHGEAADILSRQEAAERRDIFLLAQQWCFGMHGILVMNFSTLQGLGGRPAAAINIHGLYLCNMQRDSRVPWRGPARPAGTPRNPFYFQQVFSNSRTLGCDAQGLWCRRLDRTEIIVYGFISLAY